MVIPGRYAARCVAGEAVGKRRLAAADGFRPGGGGGVGPVGGGTATTYETRYEVVYETVYDTECVQVPTTQMQTRYRTEYQTQSVPVIPMGDGTEARDGDPGPAPDGVPAWAGRGDPDGDRAGARDGDADGLQDRVPNETVPVKRTVAEVVNVPLMAVRLHPPAADGEQGRDADRDGAGDEDADAGALRDRDEDGQADAVSAPDRHDDGPASRHELHAAELHRDRAGDDDAAGRGRMRFL